MHSSQPFGARRENPRKSAAEAAGTAAVAAVKQNTVGSIYQHLPSPVHLYFGERKLRGRLTRSKRRKNQSRCCRQLGRPKLTMGAAITQLYCNLSASSACSKRAPQHPTHLGVCNPEKKVSLQSGTNRLLGTVADGTTTGPHHHDQ